MQVYVVGGAVRDALLGLPVQDHDWVVVGATPEDMVAKGFRPVGKDFPVFLHPDTHEEYALARTERKHGRGYRGFEFFVSPDVLVDITGGSLSAGARFTQNGTITLNNGGSLSAGDGFTQNGSVSINSGGTVTMGTANSADMWTNYGTLTLNPGGTLNLGGSFNADDIGGRLGTFNRSGGMVNLTGSFDLYHNDTILGGASSLDIHTGQLSLGPSGTPSGLLLGPLDSIQGTISNGVIYSSGSTPLQGGNGSPGSKGELSNVTLGTISNPALVVTGGFNVPSTLILGDHAVIDSRADWNFSGEGGLFSVYQPTVGPTFNVNGGNVAGGLIKN